MEVSSNFYDTLEQLEGYKSCPYWDVNASLYTIGIGTTFYPNGIVVRRHDSCITHSIAVSYVKHFIDPVSKGVDSLVTSVINQNQFDALCLFSYNVGPYGFATSTMLKIININPNNPIINTEFLKWDKARDPQTHQLVVVPGLLNRRKAESKLYFEEV